MCTPQPFLCCRCVACTRCLTCHNTDLGGRLGLGAWGGGGLLGTSALRMGPHAQHNPIGGGGGCTLFNPPQGARSSHWACLCWRPCRCPAQPRVSAARRRQSLHQPSGPAVCSGACPPPARQVGLWPPSAWLCLEPRLRTVRALVHRPCPATAPKAPCAAHSTAPVSCRSCCPRSCGGLQAGPPPPPQCTLPGSQRTHGHTHALVTLARCCRGEGHACCCRAVERQAARARGRSGLAVPLPPPLQPCPQGKRAGGVRCSRCD